MAQHKLVIAEKPSVAQNLAAVIGATVRKDGYLEGNGWRVSWCVGHLAGLADADSYDPKYAKWRYDDLPILPEHWQMVVGKDKKKQFDILKKLMNAPDVTEVVNACDAGREGELIFRSVYELADCQKPIEQSATVDTAALSTSMLSVISRPEALAFLFAFFFNMPCLMALTATTQETHSMKWTVRIALYYVLTALIMATIAYHVGLVIF